MRTSLFRLSIENNSSHFPPNMTSLLFLTIILTFFFLLMLHGSPTTVHKPCRCSPASTYLNEMNDLKKCVSRNLHFTCLQFVSPCNVWPDLMAWWRGDSVIWFSCRSRCVGLGASAIKLNNSDFEEYFCSCTVGSILHRDTQTSINCLIWKYTNTVYSFNI